MLKQKHSTIAIIFIAILAVTSCASNNNQVQVTADSYESEEDSQAVKLDTTKKEKTEKKSKQNPNALPNSKNALEQFFTFGNKDDFVIFDNSSVFTEKVLGGIKQQKSNVVLYAKDTTKFGFGAPYMSAYYYMLMDAQARDAIEKAYNQYLNDFENKRLNRKNNKSYKQYGEITVSYRWGTISASTPNNGTGTAYLGYSFENNSPYFLISSFPIENKYFEVVQESTTRESMRLKFYFTKAQMKDYLNLVSDDSISALIRSYYTEEYELQGFEDSYLESPDNDEDVEEITE